MKSKSMQIFIDFQEAPLRTVSFLMDHKVAPIMYDCDLHIYTYLYIYIYKYIYIYIHVIIYILPILYLPIFHSQLTHLSSGPGAQLAVPHGSPQHDRETPLNSGIVSWRVLSTRLCLTVLHRVMCLMTCDMCMINM